MEAILHYSSPSTYAIVCFSLSLLSSSFSSFLSFFGILPDRYFYKCSATLSHMAHCQIGIFKCSATPHVPTCCYNINLVLDVSRQSSYPQHPILEYFRPNVVVNPQITVLSSQLSVALLPFPHSYLQLCCHPHLLPFTAALHSSYLLPPSHCSCPTPPAAALHSPHGSPIL